MRAAPLILACLAVWPLAAQTFRVHVVNSLTGAPVAVANVVAAPDHGARLWGRTDAAGSFTGAPQAAGSYLVTVSRRGYRMTSGGMGKMVEVTPG
ncbi:MAG TPA: carboxypeptidase regulatory-like domain-containing protein, partial [Candidatus Solibacter sp.]